MYVYVDVTALPAGMRYKYLEYYCHRQTVIRFISLHHNFGKCCITGEPGPKSDITMFREKRDNFDPKQKFKGDLGYLREDLIDKYFLFKLTGLSECIKIKCNCRKTCTILPKGIFIIIDFTCLTKYYAARNQDFASASYT
jgi:hypothetical protein